MEVLVQRHPIFQRQDTNIFSTVPISYAIAALGGEVLIDTIDGRVAYEVKAGTQTDTRIRLKGKGVPVLHRDGVRGDHYVTLVVQTPERLSHEAKELLKQFDQLTGNSLESVKNTSSAGTATGNTTDSKEKKKKGFFNK